MLNNNIKRGISGSTIKFIAILFMLLDHIGWFLIDRELHFHSIPIFPKIVSLQGLGSYTGLYLVSFLFHALGRLAFPLFLFLLTEGIRHTRSVVRYGTLLLIFAVISEIPFDLCKSGHLIYLRSQNVFFTLLLSMIAIYCIRGIKDKPILKIVIIVSCFVLAYIIKCDYGARGVLLACSIELYREKRILPSIIGVLAFVFIMPQEILILLALPIVMLYNGKKGLNIKYCFYAFYPVHLLVIYAISEMVF